MDVRSASRRTSNGITIGLLDTNDNQGTSRRTRRIRGDLDIDALPHTPLVQELGMVWAEEEKLRLLEGCMTTVAFLARLHRLGVHLWVEGERLRYQAPDAVVTPALRRELAERKADIIAFLSAAGAPCAVPAIPPAARDGSVPLSFAQQRLWFLDQLAPGMRAYAMPLAVRLNGQLQLAALAQSFAALVQRHEMLRTHFDVIAGRPAQLIAPPDRTPGLAVMLLDLCALPFDQRDVVAQRLAVREAQRPFDLARGPLLRITLLRVADDAYLLVLILHHIISDAWSLSVLLRELATLYQCQVADTPDALPDLPIQYADYAIWQRDRLQQAVGVGQPTLLQVQLAYWQVHLAGAPPVLTLPSDRPRPAVQRFAGALQPFAVRADLADGLRGLNQQAGTTLFMTTLAAFLTLVYRYTSQTDLVVGTPISGRTPAEVEGLIGLFVNTLVLRVDLAGNPAFETLLARVRQVALGAFAHADLPFEQLVEELQPLRDLSYTPLFQVMFVLQNAAMRTVKLPSLTLRPVAFDSETAKCDLTLTLIDAPQELHGIVEYNTDLFDAATITRLAGHFQQLLAGIVANPSCRIAELPLLSAAERAQVVLAWNDTATAYPQDQCAHTLFAAQAARSPDAVAVAFDETNDERRTTKADDSDSSFVLRPSSPMHLTYRALDQRANQLAHLLRTAGVGPEVLVGIRLERSLELVIALLGVLKAGGAYVPLDPAYPAARLAFMLKDSRATVLITANDAGRRTTGDGVKPSFIKTIDLTAAWPLIAQAAPTPPSTAVTADNLAYVIYTSGSTGTPKGVLISHAAIVNRLLWMQATYALDARDVVLQKTPFSFDVSVWEFFWPLISGARLVLARPAGQLDSSYLADLIAAQQISTLHFVPTLLHAFLDEPDLARCAGLRRVICSGEALPLALHTRYGSRLRAPLSNLYGPTEAAVDVTAWRCRPDGGQRTVPIGRPIANTQIYLLSRALALVPVGVAGELYIGGVQLARGYLNRPALTAERFVPNPFAPTNDAGRRTTDDRAPADRSVVGRRSSCVRLYKTGDLARYRPDGAIEYLGRIDGQVKLRGVRIELGEIATVLAACPLVRKAAVLVREDAPGDARLVAYVVPADDERRTTNDERADPPFVQELRDFLGERLPTSMLPAAFVLLDALPLTANGKLDRAALPAPDASGQRQEADFVAARTPVEELLAGIWSQLLRVERVGVHDNFFDLGGHSLLATQLLARLRVAFQVELPLRALFAAPTVAALAMNIAAAQQGPPERQAPALLPVARDGALPLSFAQQRLWFLDRLVPGNPFYNVPAGLRMTGALDLSALARSLNTIIARHEALRTTFAIVDAQPVQQIAAQLRLHLPLVDLQALPAPARSVQARLLARDAVQRPFDLVNGPLVRVTLVRLHKAEHVLLLTTHHIIADGWSTGVFVRELARLYRAFHTGVPAALPSLPIQYADFAIWQRTWFQGAVLAAQLDYWRRTLADDVALALPLDRPRPPIPTFRGAQARLVLPYALSMALRSVSRQADVTLFMTLLAAFQTMLARYSGQTDIRVGSGIANRTRLEVEELIGFFVNSLVMRTNLAGNPRFCDLLTQVREVALGAYAHQDLPFEQLVEYLQPERDLRYSPLFQVAFVFQNFAMPALELPGLVLQAVELEVRTAKHDLTLYMWDAADELVSLLEYSTDLFDASTAARMLRHFATLLSAIAEDPQRRLAALPLLRPAEQWQLLGEWNNTALPLPANGVLGRFAAQVARTPDAVAVTLHAASLSYRALDRRANQLAQHLRRMAVGPEVVVGVCLERTPEQVVAVLGVLKAGGAFLPLDPATPAERLAFMLEDSRAQVLITTNDERRTTNDEGVYSSCVKIVDLDADGPLIARQPVCSPVTSVSLDTLAYVIYTSGSTGRPKGVLLQHDGLTNIIGAQIAGWGACSDHRLLQFASPSFDAAVAEIFIALLSGATLCLVPNDRRLPGPALLRLMQDQAISMVTLPPSVLTLLTPATLPALRTVVFVAEACSPELIDRWSGGRRVFNGYGPTETTIGGCFAACVAGADRAPIGRPFANMQNYVLDRHMRAAPVGVPGELYLGGVGVSRGYLGRPDLTAERFVPNPFVDCRLQSADCRGDDPTSGYRLYKTGDRARWLPDGNLEFLGRVDDQIKLRGFRIEPDEIATVLERHPAVQSAAVLAREDAPGALRLVAYVVPTADHAPAAAPSNGPAPAAPAPDTEQVAHWQTLFDDAYRQSDTAPDAAVNFAGWNSSYTGAPIPADEMREWVEATVARILALRPRRVLEIGCGTGLLLLRIAPHCEHYCGTDFSRAALGYLAQQLAPPGRDALPVTLLERPADDFTDIAAGMFDLVILNSVVQYFPTIDYLAAVLAQAVQVVAPGGRIFVGDVRSLPLLAAFHASVQLQQAAAALPLTQLWPRVRQQVRYEEELAINPAFFTTLQERLPMLARVAVQLKRGQAHNELTLFRYDVVLHVGPADGAAPSVEWQDWQRAALTLPALRQLLVERAPAQLGLRRVPNARLRAAVQALAVLRDPGARMLAGELRERLNGLSGGIEPEALCALAAECQYTVQLTWSGAGDDGCLDALFTRMGDTAPVVLSAPASAATTNAPAPWHAYANDPLWGKRARMLVPELRRYLQPRLPDYMLPSAVVVLDSLPLTTSGKLDRRALPLPDTDRSAAQRFAAPRSPAEEVVAHIWEQVLGITPISIDDDFFALGGHSLLATQVVARVRQLLQVELPVRSLFEAPTIAGLAERIAQVRHGGPTTIAPPLERVARTGPVPLSFAQQRLWFLDQLTPNSPLYNIPATLRLSGRLDLAAVHRSLAALVARHEALRTTFAAGDGAPVQRIAPSLHLALPLLDLHRCPPDRRSALVQQLAVAEAQRPFDLARGPLIRAQLLRLAPTEHALLLTVHHIVSDGWSVGVLIRELTTLYAGSVRGQAPALPALPLQYADFALWQRAWLQGPVLEAQLAYWRRQLADLPTLALPTDRPRPAFQSFRGTTQPVLIPPARTAALNALSRQTSTTLFITLLAAFQTLLSRYTGQADIVIGVPLANRARPELEGLIGFFVNTLVLRGDLSGDPSFRALLARVREVTLEAHAHQDLPFEQLVEELAPLRDPSRNPLFQVMLVLQNMPMTAITLPELRVQPIDAHSGTAKFDLWLGLSEGPHGLSGALEYNTDLFDAVTITRLRGHLLTLLAGITANPDRPLSALPLLTDPERFQLIREWNATATDYPQTWCIHVLFAAQAARTPDALAAVYGEQHLSYQELHQRASQLAGHLRTLGVVSGTRVGVCVPRSLELLVGLLGLLTAGAAYVPLDPATPPARLAFMLTDSQVPVLLTATHRQATETGRPEDTPIDQLLASVAPDLLASRAVVDLGADWPLIARQPVCSPAPPLSPDHLGYVIYTSGSTGTPKGVALAHRALVNLLYWQLAYLDHRVGTRFLQYASLSFDVSYQEIFPTLASGGVVVLIAEALRRDAWGLWQLLAREQVERAYLPYAGLQQLAEAADTPGLRPRALRQITVSGEQLQITRPIMHMVERLDGCTLHNFYGPSESHAVSAQTLRGSPRGWPTLVPIGRPIANVQMHVLDRHMQPVPIGVLGELYIGGVCLADGYLGRPDLTAERFVPCADAGRTTKDDGPDASFVLRPSSGDRLYRTGDVARYRADGRLEFLGRHDQQVKIRGHRVELEEVAAVLGQHPQVQECVILLRTAATGDSALVAYVVPANDERRTANDVEREPSSLLRPSSLDHDLRAFLAERLPDYMLPAAFVRLDALPLTINGKVDRARLPVPELGRRTLEQEFVAPQTPLEQELAVIWATLLQVDQISRHDNFFALGGHSLLATRLIARVRQHTQLELPLRSLFEAPTVAGLAERIVALQVAAQHLQAAPGPAEDTDEEEGEV
jgi:amino acid adenylation domain-containing protein